MTEHGTVVSKRILLVDDQPEVRLAIRMLLELDAHSVIEAGSGPEALGLFGQEPFDLVVTDYAMPGMLGDEFAGRIKQLAPSQPILMVSGSVDMFGQAGERVDFILKKPFTLPALRHAVARALDQVAA